MRGEVAPNNNLLRVLVLITLAIHPAKQLLMRLILYGFFLLFILPIVLAAALAVSLPEAAPLVETELRLSHQDLARARKIVSEHDPRFLKAGSRYRLTLNTKDLNLAANYLLKRYTEGGVRFAPGAGQMTVQASLRLPENPINPYLNLVMLLAEEGGAARIAGLRIGGLPVPGRLVELVLDQLLQRLIHREDYQLFGDVIKELGIADGRLRVVYEWQPRLIPRVQAHLFSPANQERLKHYYKELSQVTHSSGLGKRPSLLRVLQPLFRVAHMRSQTGDVVAENRALILVVAAYLSGRGLEVLPLADDGVPSPRKLVLTLDRRQDFAEHFMYSAALAVAGDAVLADAVGLSKELSDAKGRSGFSFTDLAADRAGSRFGAMASVSVSSARRVQALLSQSGAEADVMPQVRDLPEHVSASDFKQHYGGGDGFAYRKLRQEIERRISGCRLYREP